MHHASYCRIVPPRGNRTMLESWSNIHWEVIRALGGQSYNPSNAADTIQNLAFRVTRLKAGAWSLELGFG